MGCVICKCIDRENLLLTIYIQRYGANTFRQSTSLAHLTYCDDVVRLTYLSQSLMHFGLNNNHFTTVVLGSWLGE